ncbi:MAG TPA: trehalase-like domain-containing protein, partial [Sandaracinaceae bacterium]
MRRVAYHTSPPEGTEARAGGHVSGSVAAVLPPARRSRILDRGVPVAAADPRDRLPPVDLYSAARRITRPFRFPHGGTSSTLPIGAHALIGDGVSCALVRVDGAIDWACMPRFDSPSVFGAILDADRGGLTSITPVAPFESLQ